MKYFSGDFYIGRHFINISGQRFGKLIAISRFGRYEERSSYKRTFWVCKCDCGNVAIIALQNLKSRTRPTQSCGCLQFGGSRCYSDFPPKEIQKTIVISICEYCKKKFENPYNSSKKYCSRECGGLSQKKIYVCEICGKDFFKKPKSKNKGRFCGRECFDKWNKTQIRKIELKCDYCSKLFLRKRFQVKHSTNHFCSQECAKKYQRKTSNKTKYRLNPKLRWQILKRDNFICQYCGAKPINGVSLHIDHKIPRSLGGRDVINNLITACEECNLGKTDSIDEFKQLGIEFTIH